MEVEEAAAPEDAAARVEETPRKAARASEADVHSASKATGGANGTAEPADAASPIIEEPMTAVRQPKEQWFIKDLDSKVWSEVQKLHGRCVRVEQLMNPSAEVPSEIYQLVL